MVDFETRSRVDLTACGAQVYAEDPSTEVICLAALDVRQAPALFYVWSPFPGPLSRWHLRPEWLEEMHIDPSEIAYTEPVLGVDEPPEVLLRAAEECVVFTAHNAPFDSAIWNGCGLPRTEWLDTIALGRRRGLPARLEQVSQTLFGFGKDKIGSRVMRQAMKPNTKRKEAKLLPDGRFAGEFLDPDGPRLSAIVRYCVKDVALMASAFFAEGMDAPHPDDPVLTAHEAIAARGIAVDLPLARLLLEVDRRSVQAEVEAAEVDLETLRSPLALVAWLKKQGVKVSDVTAPTLKELLA